jgi:hypothetical protein
MAVNLSPVAGAAQQFFTNSGIPLAGGLLYTYAAGTTTPTATYTDNTGSVANANPIVLDAYGRLPAELWLTVGTNYKFVLQDATAVTIGTWDNITSSAGAAVNLLNGAAGQVPWQSAANTTGFVSAGTSGQVFTSGGSGTPTWTSQSALSVGTATTATNLAGGSLGTVPYQSSAGATSMLAVGTSGMALLSNGAAAPSWGYPAASMGMPQSIVAVPATSGASTLLPSTSVNLNLTSQNVTSSTPLMVLGCVSGLNGGSVNVNRMGLSTSNVTWTGLTASSTNYLYVDIASTGALTTGFTTLAPIYTQTTTPSTTSGQNTFVIPAMQMYAGNGSTAALVCRVFVGEAVTSGSAVTSTVSYNAGTTYQSALTATLPANGTTFSTAHNLGVTPRSAVLYAQCTTIDLGYAVGDIIVPFGSGGANSDGPLTPALGTNSVAWTTYGNAAPTWMALNKSTGVNSTMTRASWSYYTVISRGW